MNYQVGNGGIIEHTYIKYGKLGNYITMKDVEQLSGFASTNAFYWNSSSGFHSPQYQTQKHATMQIDFCEPFYLTGYRTLMFLAIDIHQISLLKHHIKNLHTQMCIIMK